MAGHFSVLDGLKRAAFILAVLGGLAGGGVQPAAAQTGPAVGLSKKACAASDLPANPTPAQIANCSSGSAGIGETVYYVLTVINATIEGQAITLTDPLPADFLPVPGAQCTGGSLVLSGSTATGSLSAGQSATCIIPGYFTADGAQTNTADFSATGQQSGKKTEGAASALIFVDPTIPLPGNLSIVKTADKTVESLNGGPVAVTYTITVTNTGAVDLYTGGYLQVVDNLAALQSSGISFSYHVGNISCTTSPGTNTSPGTPLCPTLQSSSASGNTTNQSNGTELGVWQFNPGEDGLIPAGESFTISMEVTYRGPEGCIYPGTLNGVKNTAFIRFATGQMAFSDMIQGDNTSTTNLEITDHGIVDDCPIPAPAELTVTKVQKSPASGTIAWGTPIEYRIVVSNPPGIGATGQGVGPTVTNIAVTDVLVALPGMPNVDVTAEMACLTDPNNCIPTTTTTTTINQLSVQVPVNGLTVLSLADGQTEEIQVILTFKPLSCLSYSNKGPSQSANYGKISYQIETPVNNGTVTSQHEGMAGPVITDHETAPDCTLRVEKTGPEEILFGQPFTYVVTYENYGNDPIDIGTLLDAMAINVPDYAATLSGNYSYTCSTALPNLFQSIPLTSFTIGFNSDPAQGTRLLQTLAPNVPVTLPGNTTLTCAFEVILDQPDADNPYCMGKGYPYLVNAALMDVSHYFNTNLPVPPQAYATTLASLPLCRHVSVTKTIDPSVVAPGGDAEVTLRFHNHSDHAIFGASVQDVLDPKMTFLNFISPCTFCAPGQPVPPSVTSPNTVSAVFGSIPPNSYGEVKFKAKVAGPAPSIVPNTMTGSYEPPPGNWYDQSPELTASDIIGVFELFPVTITKEIVNTAPSQPPNGPFTFNASCAYAFGGYTFAFTGTASVTLPNATATFMSSAGVQMMVPVGATCTFTETGLPAANGAYGFSAVGYSPAAPTGNAGQITVVAGPNEGLVENCYGPATANPLNVVHAVGKECPPIPVGDKTTITKTCGPAVLGPDGKSWVSQCTVDVMTTGQFPAGLTVSENFYGSNGDITLNATSPAALQWSCDPSPMAAPGPHVCTFTGGTQANPGPNTASFDYTVTFADEAEVSASKNCAVVADSSTVLGEDCTGFEVKVVENPLEIRKVVVNNAPGSVAGLSFQVIVGCSNSPGTQGFDYLQDGEKKPFWMYVPNTTCTVSEGTIPVTDACGPGMVPEWTESYAPSNVVTLSPSGTQVTITNTLDCKPVIPQGRLLIRKSLDTSAAPGANVAGLTFPVSLTCGGTVQPGTIAMNAPWSVSGLSTSTPCTVAENVAALPTAGICPQRQTASWSVSYIPTNQTVTPTVAGASLVVVNKLTCTQSPPPVRQIFVKKVVVNNAPGAVAGLVFPITVACSPNTPSANSPMTVGHTDGLTTIFGGAQGDTCTISEPSYPTTNACGKGMVPVWSTAITPSATLTVAATNPLVTVTNTLTCKTKIVKDDVIGDVIDILPNPIAFPQLTLTKTCQPAVPVAGASFAQAICTITVTQTAGAPLDQIVVTETLMSGANGAQITSLTGPGWSFPALPVAATVPVTMQLPGAAMTGTPPQSTITAVVQLPNAEAATGGQNCVSVQGLDPEGLELVTTDPVCAPLVNGSATIVPDPTGPGPALELTHTSAGPCRDDREKQTYTCLFTLDVTNPSDVDFVGPEVISQSFGESRPLEVSGKGEGWSCTPGQQNATCVNGDLALLPGGGTSVETSFLLPAQRDGGTFTTCARLGIPEDDVTRVLLAQQAAQAFGLDVGQPDGVMGPKTRAAVSEMQERLGLPVTGEPDNALFLALGLRLDKGVAPLCVTVDLPPMAAPECRKGEEFVDGKGCQPIRQPNPKPAASEPVEKAPDPVATPLQCDPETTVLRDGECKCRKEGTVKLTETTCG